MDMRTYTAAEAAVFHTVRGQFGELHNFASKYPLTLNGHKILSSEALYQMCRFPHHPEIQKRIMQQGSAFSAKQESLLFRDVTRADWLDFNVMIMEWVVTVKLIQHWEVLTEILSETGDLPIVEKSAKDDFWGAVPRPDGTLVGMNYMGRIWRKKRTQVVKEGRKAFATLMPPEIPNFLLFGEPFQGITLE